MGRCARIRTWQVTGSVGLSLLCWLTGCDKVPTWDELTKGKSTSNETPATVVQQPVQPASQPVQPAAPPKPSAEEVLAKFKSLKSHEVTDANIAELTSLEQGIDQVTEINAAHSTVTDKGLANLRNLTSLRSLKLVGTRVGDLGCAAIGQVPTLEELSLTGENISDKGMNSLRELSHLQSLTLDNAKLGADGYDAIGQLPALEKISLSGSNVTDQSMKLISEAKTIHELDLENLQITDEGLEFLSNLDNLTRLNVCHCHHLTFYNLGKLVKRNKKMNLRVLFISDTALNDEGAKAIASINSIERLGLWKLQGMSDQHLIEMVRGKKNLVWLHAGNNPLISSHALEGLRGAKDLEFLNVEHNRSVTDEGLVYLKGLKNLKQLAFGGSGITQSGINNLRKFIPDLNKNETANQEERREER